MEVIEKIKDAYIYKKIRHVFDKRKFQAWDERINEERNKRIAGKIDPSYKKLYDLQDKFDGKRCFIVATGPSLKISDLELLNDEYTFGCNSLCKLYSQTNWRPTYYGIQDFMVYDALKPVLDEYYKNADNIIISDLIADLREVSKEFIQFPYNPAYHLYDQYFNKFYSKFSDNAYGVVYDGYSITYSLIQIAVYMGFKKIYLLGVDCSYKKGEKNHVVESGHKDRLEYLNYDKMITGYKSAKEYVDSHEVRIINCTRGGMLEVFPRKTLEEVLEEKCENDSYSTNETE